MFRYSIRESGIDSLYGLKQNKTPTNDRYYVPYIHVFIEIHQANNGFVIDDETFIMKVNLLSKTKTFFPIVFHKNLKLNKFL